MARRLSKLTLGPDLILPLEAATRRQAIVATSGAGKSNAAVVMAEQMYRAGVPWVAIDPKGDWYGIRSNADGTGPGLNVPVLGGAHADVPLDPTAGAVVARMIAERRMTCVLDVSEFDTRQDGFRFLADFAETLLKLNRTTLHLFLEEAEEYLPQKMDEKGNLPRCLGAWGRLVRRGRNHGIGSTLITQRTAVVSKDVLYLAEALYAMRVSAEPDRKVIRGWATTKHVGADIVDQLPELDDGEAFVISPGWLKRVDRIKFDRRTTFDSGATPVFGDDVVAAKLAPVDLAALTAELSEVIERAAADDPDRLRAEIAALKRQLAAAARKPAEVVEKVVEVETVRYLLPPGFEHAAHVYATAIDRTFEAMVKVITGDRSALLQARSDFISALAQPLPEVAPGERRVREVEKVTIDLPAINEPLRQAVDEGRLSVRARDEAIHQANDIAQDTTMIGGGAAAKIVAVLARHPDGIERRKLPALTGVKARNSTIPNALSKLRRSGLIVEVGDVVALSAAGRDAAGGVVDALPTGEALLDHWRDQLGAGTTRLAFDQLVERWPHGATRGILCQALNVNPNNSTMPNALSQLRMRGLLSEQDGQVFANHDLMEAINR